MANALRKPEETPRRPIFAKADVIAFVEALARAAAARDYNAALRRPG